MTVHVSSPGDLPASYLFSLGRRFWSAIGLALVMTLALGAPLLWLIGSSNPFTPAGYVGYLTRGAVFGQSRFDGVQRGPTSPGRGWLLEVTNVSVTPYTYHEEFSGNEAVLSRDNLKIAFSVHTVWRIDDQQVPLFMDRYSTTVSDDSIQRDPDAIVKMAYANFVREPLRTFARDEVQRRNGLEVKDALIAIGDAVLARVRQYAQGTPFMINSVVVGNVQYPEEVANAVSKKLAATQELQRKDTEIEIERKERDQARSAGAGYRQRDVDHSRAIERDVHSARSDRGAEADGQLAESHGRLYPVRADGRPGYRHLCSGVAARAG